jgi:hypothetical protein
MKKGIFYLTLIAALLVSINAAWAQELYVITGGGRPVGTKITQVPYTISNPGFYFLGSNLTYAGTGAAITIAADNVTLDLMGFTLAAEPLSYPIGISMSGRSNVEIRNGTVEGFACGIVESDAKNGTQHRIFNIRVLYNNMYGIVLNGNNHLIKNCTATKNHNISGKVGIGLAINGSGQIIDCLANNNDNGIWLYGPGSILNSTACNNTMHAFILGNGVATSILVDGNSAFGANSASGGNYFQPSGTTGVVITANNSGTP